jgi:hypothetical protein
VPLSGAFTAELAKPALILFGAVEIVLPGPTYVRLLDGAGTVTFGGRTFVGRDATFGVLGGVSEFADGLEDQAPSLTLTLLPPDNSAMAALAAATAQGSAVSLWVGALDAVTGQVIADPDLVFVGETDVPTQKVSEGQRELDLTVISIFDRFLENDEGERLNTGFHQSIWAGEKGLEFVSFVRNQPIWGADAPKNVLVGTGSAQTSGTFRGVVV